MARYPNARWIPSPNHGGPLTRSLGLILHVEQGTETGSAAWFCNPQSQASSHFGVAKTGVVDQFVDTNLRSWAQAAGNSSYLSVETEGFATEPLTDAQVAAVADIYRWLHGQPEAQFGFTLAEHPGDTGLGWHGMGGAAWGGHDSCPGELRKAQRTRILTIANPTPTPTPTGGMDMSQVVDAMSSPNGGVWVAGRDGGVDSFRGAVFHGSYPGLAPKDRQGTRNCTGIGPRDDGVAEGYMLTFDDGTRYRFP
jgi:hypothetical protein